MSLHAVKLHADDLAQRLAFEKARCIAQQYPDAIVNWFRSSGMA